MLQKWMLNSKNWKKEKSFIFVNFINILREAFFSFAVNIQAQTILFEIVYKILIKLPPEKYDYMKTKDN